MLSIIPCTPFYLPYMLSPYAAIDTHEEPKVAAAFAKPTAPIPAGPINSPSSSLFFLFPTSISSFFIYFLVQGSCNIYS